MKLELAGNHGSGTRLSPGLVAGRSLAGSRDGSFIRIAVLLCMLVPAGAAKSQGVPSIYEGFTEPRYDIMVAATEIGRLEEVTVEVGDQVDMGQTIARLEDSLQQTALKIAELQAGMHGDVDAAEAEAFLHKTRLEQIRGLAAGMARPIELTRAEADLKVAEARQVAAVEQQELRQLEVERYQLQLARRRVTAPMAGIVSKIFHRPGEYITPGDPAVIRLLVIDQIFAVFNVPAEDVLGIKIGSTVEVHLRSTMKSVSGQVHSIAPDIDGESGTVRVRVALDNQSGQLRVGDRCTMQLGNRNKLAPRSAASQSQTAKQTR